MHNPKASDMISDDERPQGDKSMSYQDPFGSQANFFLGGSNRRGMAALGDSAQQLPTIPSPTFRVPSRLEDDLLYPAKAVTKPIASHEDQAHNSSSREANDAASNKNKRNCAPPCLICLEPLLQESYETRMVAIVTGCACRNGINKGETSKKAHKVGRSEVMGYHPLCLIDYLFLAPQRVRLHTMMPKEAYRQHCMNEKRNLDILSYDNRPLLAERGCPMCGGKNNSRGDGRIRFRLIRFSQHDHLLKRNVTGDDPINDGPTKGAAMNNSGAAARMTVTSTTTATTAMDATLCEKDSNGDSAASLRDNMYYAFAIDRTNEDCLQRILTGYRDPHDLRFSGYAKLSNEKRGRSRFEKDWATNSTNNDNDDGNNNNNEADNDSNNKNNNNNNNYNNYNSRENYRNSHDNDDMSSFFPYAQLRQAKPSRMATERLLSSIYRPRRRGNPATSQAPYMRDQPGQNMMHSFPQVGPLMRALGDILMPNQRDQLPNYLRRREELEVDVDNMTYEQLLELEEQMGTVDTPLSTSISSRWPRHNINKYRQGGHSGEGSHDICPICRDSFLEDAPSAAVIIETPCGHLYHEDCILSYLKKKHDCPVCRTDLEKL